MVYFQGVQQDKTNFSRSRLQQDTGQLPPWGKRRGSKGKEETPMSGTHTIQIVAGAFAVIVLGIIAYRRKQKAA
jgi:hypothetical protein